MTRFSRILCSLVAVCLAGSAFAQVKHHNVPPGSLPPPVTFAAPVPYGAGSCPISVAVADFNGDKKPDLATANLCSNSVSVLLGNGDGTFQPAVNYGVGSEPLSVAVGDFNGDGKPDLAVTNIQSGTVSVLLGNGDGTFQTAVSYSVGSYAYYVTVADFNGDGKLDLAVTNDGGSSVSVLLGNGDGTFQTAVNYSAGSCPAGVAAVDVNGDNKPDLVIADDCSNSVSVLLGNGDGTFQTAVSYGSGGNCAWGVAVADLNGDNKPDVVVANQCSNSVSVLLGNGDGTFQTAVSYGSGGTYPLSVAIADLNEDGNPDLAVANQCADNQCQSGAGPVSVLLGNGDGTFQPAVTFGTGGNYPFSVAVADFNGDTQPDMAVANEGSSAIAILLNNTRFVTTTTLASSPNPSLGGQTVVFSATISSTKAGATGNVTFMDGTTSIGVAALNGSGVATLAISSLAVGSHNITAVYAGDTIHVGSTSGVLNQVVNLVPTATRVTTSLTPSIYGQQVTFTASVSASIGTPTGTITFEDGANIIGSVSINGSAVALTTSLLAAQSHSISAVYSGDATHQTSTSSPVTQVVNQATSTTALVSSSNPSLFGQTVTFTATVTPQFSGIATGSVVFLDGSNAIGAGELAGNVGTFSASSLTTGSHKITAVYGGDQNFIFSSSSALTQVVQAPTATALSSSLNPSTFGQSVTFSATVTSAGGTPNGKVTFKNGTAVLGSPTLVNGVASVTTSAPTAGSPTITAAYNGSTGFLPSSNSLVQVVDQAGTATTVTSSSSNPSTFGQSVTFTASVTSSGGTPTGSVTFKNGAATLGKGTLSSGTVSFTTSATQLPSGADQITALYNGDKNHAASTSAPFTQTVNKASTSTQLTTNPSTITAGQTVTLTATVTAAPGTVTGTVTFTDGTKTLGHAALGGGSATINTNRIKGSGLHAISATYQGNGNYLSSVGTTTVTVQ